MTLPPRHAAGDDDLRRAHDAARAIATTVIGRDPGVMLPAESISHYVYVGSDVVVKVIDAGGHPRLDREIALSASLPTGLTAPLLGSGLYPLDTSEVRYACYGRVPGTTPGMGMPNVDASAARQLAEEAVERLHSLHTWTPTGPAECVLTETLDHGGFTTRAALLAEIERIVATDRDHLVPRHLLDGLTAIARRADRDAQATVAVHADCHWGNWLAEDRHVTSLLDFEWARFGEPADDWFFLAAFSGPHRDIVLEVIAHATSTSEEVVRAQCELRSAAFIASDLCFVLEHPDVPTSMTTDLLRKLDDLITGRLWRPR